MHSQSVRLLVVPACLALTLLSGAAPEASAAPKTASAKAKTATAKPAAAKQAKPSPAKPTPAKVAPAKAAPVKPVPPAPEAAVDTVAAAKKVFADRLCASCHTVRVAGISRQPPPPGPDLSQVGRTMDAQALDGWLRKGEQRGGKPHAVRFLGSDAEWQTLVDWLVTLK